MAHTNSLIREAVVAGLLNQTAAAANVQDTPVREVQADRLPFIAVSSGAESVAPLSVHGSGPQERLLVIRVRPMVQQLDNVQRALDDLREQIEQRMVTVLAPYVWDGTLNTSEPDYSENAEKPVAAVDMEYQIRYYTQASGPAFYA